MVTPLAVEVVAADRRRALLDAARRRRVSPRPARPVGIRGRVGRTLVTVGLLLIAGDRPAVRPTTAA